MRNIATNHRSASEVLAALGVLAVAQEEERPDAELDALSGNVLSALDSYIETRREIAA